MPISYSGRDGEDDPDQEQARLKQRPAVQPTSTATPLYGRSGAEAQPTMARTFQQPQMPGGTPGQQSQTPWSMNLGSLNGAQGAKATPWAQSVMPQLGNVAGMDQRFFSGDPAQNTQMKNANAQSNAAQQQAAQYAQQQQQWQQQLAQSQHAQAAQQQNQQQNANQFTNAFNNQQFNQAANAQNQNAAYNQMRSGMGGGAGIGGGLGGAMPGGGGMPNWGALAQRFGGAPMGGGGGGGLAALFGGLQGGGGGMQGGGGNPWLQNMLSGAAQRFSGLQRGGGMPGRRF